MAKITHRKRATHRKSVHHAAKPHARRSSVRPSASSQSSSSADIGIPSMPESDSTVDEESVQIQNQARVREDDSEDEAGTYGPGTGEVG
jgi:hypothetical protein